MAYVTQSHSTLFSSIWAGISGFFSALGHAITMSASADARLRKVEMLNAKSDAELAAMNLRREDIAAFVFRDLMYM